MRSNVTTLPAPVTATGTRSIHRHFNIVVAGEFNAGKSSVVNLLLRKNLLPATVGYSQMPPLRIFPSAQEVYTIRTATNESISKDAFLRGKLHGTAVSSARIEAVLDDFNGAVISEVSVGQHGELDPEAEAILQSADLLIWCTMGQRAWCLTEITIIESLPAKILETAILAVTRSDYLRNDIDRDKVKTRLEREAAPYFKQIEMLDCSQKSIRNAHDQVTWMQSGGEALLKGVMQHFRASDFYGKTAPTADLQEINDFREVMPAKPTQLSAKDIFTAWQNETDGIEVWIGEQSPPTETDTATFVLHRVTLFSDSVLTERYFEAGGKDVNIAFKNAANHIKLLLQKMDKTGIAMRSIELALQLEDELRCKAHKNS